LRGILGGNAYESNISAKQAQAEENARISQAGKNGRWPFCASAPTVERKKTSYGVSYVRVARRKAGIGALPRLIIVVGKNVSPLAVKRNLLKRRIRAIMRPALKTSPFSYKVVAGKEALTAPFVALRDELFHHV
jgi:ribonuclease P protein component